TDWGIEGDIAVEVEALRHVPGIAQELRLGRVALAPVPLLLQRRVELIGVLDALHVAARARIAVPVPGAANIAAGLENAYAKAAAGQAVQHVHAGKASPDDRDVEGALGRYSSGLLWLWHRSS